MAEHLPQSEHPHGGRRTIAELNDRLRQNLTRPGSDRVMMTAGVAALIGDVSLFRGFHKRAELLRAVRDFDDFNAGNDPYSEHDLGSFAFEGAACLWKIDYYDLALSAGSEDPSNPAKTTRVLTIMLTEER